MSERYIIEVRATGWKRYRVQLVLSEKLGIYIEKGHFRSLAAAERCVARKTWERVA